MLLGLGCSSASKTSARHSVKKYVYSNQGGDPANQDAIEDLIYSELSKRQQALLKKYSVPVDTHSLGGVNFDIPMTMNDRVRVWIEYFVNGSGRKYYERWLARSTRFVPTQLEILKENKVPRDIIFLSMIESGFNTHAYSSAAASGLWQFIRSTGRLYGLDSDYWVDERRDPEKASLAAARHLKDLYGEFGDWYLAFAAYNAGSGKVRRAIEGVGSRNFWDLASSKYLRQETKDYVPKILAAAIIGKSPEKYGFKDVEFQDPIATEGVTLHSAADLEVIAECAGVDVNLIRLINPELIRNMTPPNHSGYTLFLPRGTKANFEKKYARLTPAEHLKNVRYVVGRGDSLKSIARDHGVTVAYLQMANPSLGNRRSVSAGTSFIIPKSYDTPPPVPVASSYPSTSRGKKLIDLIADKGNPSEGNRKKTKIEKVKPATEAPDGEMQVAWNEKGAQKKGEVTQTQSDMKEVVKSDAETVPVPENVSVEDKIAQALTHVDQPSSSSDQKTLENPEGPVRIKSSGEENQEPKKVHASVMTHQVKRGENLTTISEKYGVKVSDLRAWNHLGEKHGLLAYQTLIIRNAEAGETDLSPVTAQEKPVAKIKITKASKPKVIAYRVRKGDTLHKIAKKYEVSASELISYNGLSRKSFLKPGVVLKIPTRVASSRG